MKQKLVPSHPHGARLAEIFSYAWKWISTPNDGGRNDWKTNNDYPIKPRTLWQRWQDAAVIIGTRFSSSTQHALLDIDAGSQYIDLLPQLQQALETIGIVRTIPLRSSWSGGIHLYIPLPQAYPTFSVACALRQCLEAQGFALAPGQLEVFPNEKPYGRSWLGEFHEYNGHRLPLQPYSGSCLLDDDLQPMNGALAIFWALWDNAMVCNDHTEISEALAIARSNRRRRGRKATGPAQAWKADLETIIAEGWTGSGQTNRLLKEIATYGRVFEKLHGVELFKYILKIAENAPGFRRHCNHQHEIDRRCATWANAVEKYYWPLGDEPLRERKKFTDVCQQRADDARYRIAEAVKHLRFYFDGKTIKQMVEMITGWACCSAQTLYRAHLRSFEL
ncbi:MAG: hypothetical protein AAF773_03530 [Cyanobacteria bacterium P01_D01_bin.115]